MNTPWFFLSYASIDEDYNEQVRIFFLDLVKAVRAFGQLKSEDTPDEDIGFLAFQLPDGTYWPVELRNKLNSCRVLVCLYSNAYFRSEHCGREFEIFRNRLNNYTRGRGALPRPSIIPVRWFIPENFNEKLLPAALQPIQCKLSGFDEATNQKGIYYYLSIHANKGPNYKEYVNKLAERITRAATDNPELPPLTNAFDFETTVNAFADYLKAPTKADEVHEPSNGQPSSDAAKTNTVHIRNFWYLSAVAGLLIIIATTMFFFRCRIMPGLCAGSNRQTLLIRKEHWEDNFTDNGSGGHTNWEKENSWDAPGWQPRWEKGINNGVLPIEGADPGIVKEWYFDDFEMIFEVRFEEGYKAGWMVRAEGDRKTGYQGFCFVLEKTNDAFQLMGYRGTPQSLPEPKPEWQRIPITQFEPSHDTIIVSTRVENDQIFMVFQLASLTNMSRADLKQCVPATVKIENNQPKAGYVGLFADKSARFSIDTLEIYPIQSQSKRLVVCDKSGPTIYIK